MEEGQRRPLEPRQLVISLPPPPFPEPGHHDEDTALRQPSARIRRNRRQDGQKGPAMGPRIARALIEARCTDEIMFTFAFLVGITVGVSQLPPLFLNNWVEIREPRTSNATDDAGENLEVLFNYQLGYWEVCRYFAHNSSTPEFFYVSEEAKRPQCEWNPLLTGVDLGDFGLVSPAVIVRLATPAILHAIGGALCTAAFSFGLLGYCRRSNQTLVAAVLYIIGSIAASTGVLMLVCVVDDELTPRMRPTPTGNPSKFSYKYGSPFWLAALSFLPVQLAACLHAFLYFRRFPTAADKLLVVPGLDDKVRCCTTQHKGGASDNNRGVRRGSLATYTPAPYSSNPSYYPGSYRRTSSAALAVALAAVQEHQHESCTPTRASIESATAPAAAAATRLVF